VDLAEAHRLALVKLRAGRLVTVAVNLGTGTGSSIFEVLRAAQDVTGKEVPHTLGRRRPGDQPTLLAVGNKAGEVLGWEPRFEELQTILETAWNWLRRHPDGYPK
jgi:UDP-glucose 4-epimerase